MTINRDRLEQYFSISHHYNLLDKRFLAAIAYEFELAEFCFGRLITMCNSNTNHDQATFNPSEEEVLQFGLHSTSFIDHCSRLLKLMRGYFKGDPEAGPLIAEFETQVPFLPAIRNALQHDYERITAAKAFELKHPLCGEFAWYALTPKLQVDVYFILFGAFVDESAFAVLSTAAKFRRIDGMKVIDHLTFSAFDVRFDISDAFFALSQLVEGTADLLQERFLRSVETNKIELGGPDDIRLPSMMCGRARLEGVELAEGEYPNESS